MMSDMDRLRLVDSAAPDARPAIIDPLRGVATYADLRASSEPLEQLHRGLVFAMARNSLGSAVSIVLALQSKHAVALLNPYLPSSTIAKLVALYRPVGIVGMPDDLPAEWPTTPLCFGAGLAANPIDDPASIAPGLKLLLSTSGTTGAAKMVRLSSSAVAANANQIGAALSLSPDERALAHLPLHYSFGLSVLTSHIACGASVVLTEDSVTSKGFWDALRKHDCTSLSGVPTHFELVRRLGFERLRVPSLKTFCQAGGRASIELLTVLQDMAESRDGRLFVMYGQTEAGPRMSTLPFDMARKKLGSVGLPLTGGRFELVPLDGTDAGLGQVVYHGPNVMWGYAERPEDLLLGDECQGRLETGDLGQIDSDGCLWLQGRVSRIAKVHGLRISLDEIESAAGRFGPCAATELNDRIGIVIAADKSRPSQDICESVQKALYSSSTLPTGSIVVIVKDTIPVKANGKIDYGRVLDIFREAAA